MFWQRAIITFSLGPLAVVLIYLGGWYYFLPLLLIMFVATFEYLHIVQKMGRRLSAWVFLPAVALLLLSGQWLQPDFTGPALLISFIMASCYGLFLYEYRPGQGVALDWMAMVSGIILLGWLGSHFFRVRQLPEMAWQWTMVAMVGTWVADSAAYLFGKRFGRHKLAPRLSPNKTVEGYFGSFLFGSLTVILLGRYLELPLGSLIGLALLLTILGTAGDLSISLLKREAGVKDSGNLLPGHGGALDRIDSLVWAVAITYYWVLFTS